MLTCTACSKPIEPLDVFPKGKCLTCHAAWADTQPMPTAADIVRMWGGKA